MVRTPWIARAVLFLFLFTHPHQGRCDASSPDGLHAAAGWRAPETRSGKLDSLRKTVGKPHDLPGTRTKPDPPPGRDSHDEDDSDSSVDLDWIHTTAQVVAAPFYWPHRWLDDDFDEPSRFAAHPYDGVDGAMHLGWHSNDAVPAGSRRQSWKASLEWSDDFENVRRLTVRGRLDDVSRLGLETGWTLFRERRSGGAADPLVIGKLDLSVQFAQNRKLLMRAGVGGRVLLGEPVPRGGFNFCYGAEMFPGAPWTLEAGLNLGTLGDASYFQTRPALGITVRGWHLFAGYDYVKVGEVAFDGPVAGFGIWF